MTTLKDQLTAATEQAAAASAKIAQFVNGDSSTVIPTTSGPLPSLQKFIADQSAYVDAQMGVKIDAALADSGFDARLDTLEVHASTVDGQIDNLQTVDATHGQQIEDLQAADIALQNSINSVASALTGFQEDVANDYVPKTQTASDSTAGIIKIAADTDVADGLVDDEAVTPAGLLALFVNQFTAAGNGKLKLPGGLKLQWLRHYPLPAHSGGSDITFPEPFQSSVYYISPPTLIANTDGFEGSTCYIRNDWTLSGCRMVYSGAPNAQLQTNGVFIYVLGKD